MQRKTLLTSLFFLFLYPNTPWAADGFNRGNSTSTYFYEAEVATKEFSSRSSTRSRPNSADFIREIERSYIGFEVYPDYVDTLNSCKRQLRRHPFVIAYGVPMFNRIYLFFEDATIESEEEVLSVPTTVSGDIGFYHETQPQNESINEACERIAYQVQIAFR